ncbi:uncharacterized protein LOC108093267 [Drosophila ficusphila]|uniref:uncharacterized protein LOC108093267 n=1 Tax=Drosophila ficusphila TaxID=30025 RepID=UPI0007E838D1|nr:uncharacterized protein LOC108093267 [Drosophila ficusphila]
MNLQFVLIFLLATFKPGLFYATPAYKPLKCEETNKDQKRASLLASCLPASDCFLTRPFGICPKKQVCCAKKRDFIIDEKELVETTDFKTNQQTVQ